jgi:GT2 family glycosyltransferase/glycosyltransferase involved in cell wall biosynthesis
MKDPTSVTTQDDPSLGAYPGAKGSAGEREQAETAKEPGGSSPAAGPSTLSPAGGDLQPTSLAYWNRRFATDWTLRGGCEQTRDFMRLLVLYLPAQVYEEIHSEGLSLLDCGCALGDGTAVLRDEFPRSTVQGFDFSAVAIAEARRRFPDLELTVGDLASPQRHADVLIVSHCLEHLTAPVAALRALLRSARRYVLVLVPYLEGYPPHEEHLRIVHEATFPESLEGWTVAYRALLPPVPTWDGDQLLLVYSPGAGALPATLSPLPNASELRASRRLRELAGICDDAAARAMTARVVPQVARLASAVEAIQLEGPMQRLASAVREMQTELSGMREDLALAERRRLEAEQARQAEELRHRELSTRAANRERSLASRISTLEEQVRRGHHHVEELKREGATTVAALALQAAELESGKALVQEEAAQLRAALAEARRALQAVESSRLWRLGHFYWSFRRRVGLTGGEAAASVAPVHPPSAVEALPTPAAVGEDLVTLPAAQPALPSFVAPLPHQRFDVIVLSIINWDFRFQRPQQLALQMARHGHRVFYLSTTRFLAAGAPPWDLVRKADGVAELAVCSRPLDVYRGRLEDEDLSALEDAFADLLERLALADTVCLVQLPFWAPLAARLKERFGWRVVYDCMDEWASFPGIGDAVLALEDGLVRQADLTVVSAELLRQKLAGRTSRLALVRNGVDLDHYARHYGPGLELAGVAHPVIGYFGALASWVDVELLEKIARRFGDATLVLAGGCFDVDPSGLERLPNVRLLGQRPYDEMPKLLWSFDVCIIPFLVNDITHATNPVKLYEYLSSGKPVVAPRMAELLLHEETCYLADGHEAFLDAIGSALAEPEDAPVRDRRRATARDNAWNRRYSELTGALVAQLPLVSVVVVSHGGQELTGACLRSLLAGETWPRLEVLVVDNDSPDGTRQLLESLDDRRLRLFLMDRNLGFPAANNLALREARGEVVVFLNNDTVVPPGLMGRLVRAVSDPSVGLACPTTNFCGNEARVEPLYDNLDGLPAFAAQRARRHAGELMDISVAAMYCAAARREVLTEVGPLDEAFGIGMFEDDDYSLRVREAGYRVVCVEDAYVHHVGQGSFQTLTREAYAELWRRNQQRFELKWGRPWTPHVMRAGVVPPTTKIGLERDAAPRRTNTPDGDSHGGS